MDNAYLCVDKTSQYADIETQEIDRIILVVAGIKHHLNYRNIKIFTCR